MKKPLDHVLESSRPEKSGSSRKPGSLRIIGGQWRSRRLEVAGIPGLRPTPDRVRQTLFDWLQYFWAGQGSDLSGMRVLDAFAGSGALGLEAASRGASHVCFLEKDPSVSKVLAKNIAGFQSGKLRLLPADALQAMPMLAHQAHVFDLVLLDPPFASGLGLRAAKLAIPLLSAQGLLYLESAQSWDLALQEADEPLAGLLSKSFVLLRKAKAASLHYHLFRCQNDVSASPAQASNQVKP